MTLKSNLALCVLFCMTSAFGKTAESVVPSSEIQEVKKTLPALSFDAVLGFSPAQLAYFKYYDLHIDGVEHFFGTFQVENSVIACHVFRPAKSKGAVILVHGYYDHSGIMSKLITSMVTSGYTVAVYDQPGHGLSSGERAAITDFSEYTIVLKEFVRICRGELDGPYHLVAHSMGCAVVVDYLLVAKPGGIGKVVFLAPLIRSAHWGLSGFGKDLTGGMITYVPRKFRKNSSDKDFLNFMKEDPLQARRVPMSWVGALREWNKRAEKYGKSEKPIKVIQGTRDSTVDAAYNMKYLKRKFDKTQVTYIKGAGHQLMNESEEFRTKVLGLVKEFLRTP